MDTEYIDKKIKQCKKLVKNATSEAQKEIYQGYLDYWITKSNLKTDTETSEGALVEAPSIPVDVIEVLTEPQKEEEKETEEKAILEKELQDAKDKLEELEKEEEFKLAYPNKNAYYNRDNKTYKTNAFKEFLISKE